MAKSKFFWNKEGKTFPTLQPPAAFSATPSAGSDAAHNACLLTKD